MKAPRMLNLYGDGIFIRAKRIQNTEDLINNISVIKACKNGLLAVTRHYEDGWFLYVNMKGVNSENSS